ncbi:hypothetical protein B4V02_23830 [Paenibacillus kribbensis]|uniref:Uncharacterized protein n=1 Tax=Paenibacillus kribbensis TaxID=172713 RepID=A0A222WSC8_9BACL|nr:hypothetical protein [Paenibacillus kribbensis]ASR49499.1 hypothetical protein B4V02_23830 [Paenibacillus kribbensis]
MAFTREYAATLTLNLDQVRKTQRAQRNIYDKGLVEQNTNALADALSASLSILGAVFFKYTAPSLAAGIASILASLVPNEKEVLKDLVYTGYWQMGYLEDFLVDNQGRYDMIEVKFPFIEYQTQGIRFITGKGVVTRVHSTSGGWMVL